jgi:hypothetical protein
MGILKKNKFVMVVITYVYNETPNVKQTIKSFERFGYEVAVIRTDTHRGNGEALRLLYDCYKRASTGHINFMYADAADSFCQRKFFAPYDKIIYQTEKACYPHTWVAHNYPNTPTAYSHSPWKYLNGGGYCGSTKLIVEFFERYGLTELQGDANGQHEQMLAYIQAKKDGFPIQLDDGCELFQSMAFADPSEFAISMNARIKSKVLWNKITNQVPAVLHFNGLTDMSILKELK